MRLVFGCDEEVFVEASLLAGGEEFLELEAGDEETEGAKGEDDPDIDVVFGWLWDGKRTVF